jgi:type IV secretory pathway VirB10-like protein
MKKKVCQKISREGRVFQREFEDLRERHFPQILTLPRPFVHYPFLCLRNILHTMPVNKNKKRTKKALKQRSKVRNHTGPRAYLPALDPAPKAIDGPPEANKRQAKAISRLQEFDKLRISKKRKRNENAIVDETSRKRPRSDIASMRFAEPAILKLEERWHAVASFTEQRGKGGGKVTNEIANEIGARFQVTGETVRNWAKKADLGESLMRNDGSG